METALALWHAVVSHDPKALLLLGCQFLGGAVGIMALVVHGVQPVVLWLSPRLVKMTATFISWLVSLPWVGDAIIGHKDQFQALFDSVVLGGKTLLDAIQAEADKDIEAASVHASPSPVPTPAPVFPSKPPTPLTGPGN